MDCSAHRQCHVVKPCQQTRKRNFLFIVAELIFELRQPNKEFLNKARPPLLEPNPLFFWQSLCLILAVVIVLLLSR